MVSSFTMRDRHLIYRVRMDIGRKPSVSKLSWFKWADHQDRRACRWREERDLTCFTHVLKSGAVGFIRKALDVGEYKCVGFSRPGLPKMVLVVEKLLDEDN